jgi:hypothetical protein
VALYEWHTEFSGVLFAVVADVEVVFRNAIHDRLILYHQEHRPHGTAPSRWFDEPCWLPGNRQGWFTPRAQERIRQAQRRVGDRQGQTRRPAVGRVVAELSLGFWKYLLTRHYEHSFWSPAVRHAFPYAPGGRSAQAGREAVYNRVDQVQTLRNRLAYHEPVHGPIKIKRQPPVTTDAANTIGQALGLVAWIDPATADWIEGRSRVDELLARRPIIRR